MCERKTSLLAPERTLVAVCKNNESELLVYIVAASVAKDIRRGRRVQDYAYFSAA